ncbi:hypothetical protein L2E82_24604 [Cichorium intybus]|uniref:Uncharacterized protein n=1 Tax=Cichorium intybus TaxID=13427 RepID=A0ACB9E1I1_CICIN|nr:hypothetical protein L2E82_24604 [Cichorium intybus]
MACSRKRKLSQYRNDNEQEQDHDEYRSRNNASGFLHNYPSYHVNRHLGNVLSNCNNGGVVLAESSNHHQFPSKGNNPNQVQEGTPVRLNLNRSDSLTKQLEWTLTQEKQENNHQQVLSQPQPPPIKSKASNMFAVSLKIGSWIWKSKYAGDLVVKFYYGKKKLVWEFLFGHMKKKIEIQWSHVSAINAYVQNGRLEIELGVPPEYYEEVNTERLKHTQWEKTNDFTQGQAQCCRRHTILFSPGILDDHFKKLLQHDNRLFNLSRQPFPSNSQFFNPNDVHQGDFVQYVQNLVQPTSSFAGYSYSNLPMPGVAIPNSDENRKEVPYVNEETNEEQNGNNQIQDLPFPPINVQEDSQLYDGLEPLLSDRELQLHDVQNPNSQFFNPNMEFSYDVTVVPSVLNLVQPTSSFAGHSNSNLPMPGVAIPNSDENQKEVPYVNEETNEEQNGNNQIQDLPFPPINVQEYSKLYDGLEPLLSDHELQLHDVENPNLTNQNGFNVDSTCKPFEQNHQDNSNPSGNKIDDGNHHVGPSHISTGVAFMEEPPSSGGCGLHSMTNVRQVSRRDQEQHVFPFEYCSSELWI